MQQAALFRRETANSIDYLFPADDTDECSRLHYIAEKDRLELVWLIAVIVVLRFVCDYLRSLREIFVVSFVQYSLSTFA